MKQPTWRIPYCSLVGAAFCSGQLFANCYCTSFITNIYCDTEGDKKLWPWVSNSLPQVDNSLPQDRKSFPQVTKSFLQVTKSFPHDSKIAKCLFYGTFLGPSKIFQYVTLDWLLFGTAYLTLFPLDAHTSYVPGCSKTHVWCAANCIDFSHSKLHSLLILNPFYIPITLVPP